MSKVADKPLVTVGIPVYNVEPYVEKCLRSVLEQTYQHLEVVIVDDIGSDRSMQVVESVLISHPQGRRARIVRHESNRGIGEARNTLTDCAQGKYLLFVDSDDYLEPKAVEILLNEALALDTDAVLSSCRRVDYASGQELPTFAYQARQEFVGRDAFANYVCQDLRWHVGVNAWNILFKVDFLRRNGLRFAARKDEDAVFLADFYAHVERAVVLPDITYNYVSRPGSIMGNMARDRIPVGEIRERFRADAVMTSHCESLKNRSFYDVHCARVVKHKFRAVCVALRHRRRFTEPLAASEIRRELRHPATLRQILRFRRYRCFHLFFYTLSSLPSRLTVAACYLTGKLLRWI